VHTIVVYVSTLASVSLYLYGERRSPNQPSGTLRVVFINKSRGVMVPVRRPPAGSSTVQ